MKGWFQWCEPYFVYVDLYEREREALSKHHKKRKGKRWREININRIYIAKEERGGKRKPGCVTLEWWTPPSNNNFFEEKASSPIIRILLLWNMVPVSWPITWPNYIYHGPVTSQWPHLSPTSLFNQEPTHHSCYTHQKKIAHSS